MVQKELNRLEGLLRLFPGAAVAGQSLGGWWAANLALRPEVKIRKMVLWTPLGNAEEYPIFNVTQRYHPIHQPITNTYGPHRVLVCAAKDDLIVPPGPHGLRLATHFNAMPYQLDGGHFYQSNHRAALNYMKEWIEV